MIRVTKSRWRPHNETCRTHGKKKIKTYETLVVKSEKSASLWMPTHNQEHACTKSRRLNFVLWHLLSVSQHGTCFRSPIWRLQFSGGSHIFGKKICEHLTRKITLKSRQKLYHRMFTGSNYLSVQWRHIEITSMNLSLQKILNQLSYYELLKCSAPKSWLFYSSVLA